MVDLKICSTPRCDWTNFCSVRTSLGLFEWFEAFPECENVLKSRGKVSEEPAGQGSTAQRDDGICVREVDLQLSSASSSQTQVGTSISQQMIRLISDS